MDISFYWVAAGLVVLGYFIGDGLKNFGNPKPSFSDYPTLVKEKDLHLHVVLSKEEVGEMVHKFPDVPKIELKGTTYYPYQRFMEWMSSGEIYKK
jgi:hypothetical protein